MDEHPIMSSPNRLVECRICHSEDEDSNMDTPCSCCGTLKVGLPCSLPLQMLVIDVQYKCLDCFGLSEFLTPFLLII